MSFLPKGDTAKLLRDGIERLYKRVLSVETTASGAASRAAAGVLECDTIAAFRNYNSALLSANQQVNVNGYYTAGDGGGGLYYIDAADTTSPDDGGAVIVLNDGRRAKALFEDGRVNVRRFGAKGDGTTDDTAAVQAAITYSEAGILGKPNVVFPAGIYVISTIRLIWASLEGGIGISGSGGSALSVPSGATLLHKSGATDDLIVVTPYLGNPMPAVRNLQLVGKREQNRKTPITISAVASRFSFTVPTGSLPTAPASPGTYPYYGYCFFFSPTENRYLGAGLVTGINYSTGVITLAAESDEYATPSGGSYLLTPGCSVCFSSTITEQSAFANVTGVDSTTAGYCGINLKGITTAPISEVAFDNLKIRNFHTGIRLGNQTTTYINRVYVNACSFAGIASAFPGYSRDGIQSNILIQGFYGRDPGSSVETQTFDNAPYRRTLYGYYGMESSSAVDDIRVDHAVRGFYFDSMTESQINQLLVDSPASHAVVIGYNFNGFLNRTTARIGDLQIRNIGSASDVVTTTNPWYAIYTWGDRNQIEIDVLSVSKSGNVKYFDAIFKSVGANNRIAVDNMYSTGGATTTYASSTEYPVVAAETADVATLRRHVEGAVKETVTATLTTISNPLTTTGNLSANGKTLVYSSGAVGFDSAAMFFTVGADQSTGEARTNNVTKRYTLRMSNYANASPAFQILSAFTTATSNTIYYGSVDGGLECATSHTFGTGSKGSLGGTDTFQIDNTTATAGSTPLLVRVNGDYSRIFKSTTTGILYHGTTVPQLAPTFSSLVDGATITLTVDPGKTIQNHAVILGGNRTLVISGAVSGTRGLIRIIQDGVGGRTLALPAGSTVAGGGGGVLSLTSTPNAYDVVEWFSNGSVLFFAFLGKNYT